MKDLLRRVGVALGSEHPTPRELDWVENRVGSITVPLRNKVGALDTWLENFHGEFIVVTRNETTVFLSLTDEGVAKFAPNYTLQQEITDGEGGGITPNELAVELRGTVFDELKQEAQKRRASSNMYAHKPKKVESETPPADSS